jgi:hypothetical protein
MTEAGPRPAIDPNTVAALAGRWWTEGGAPVLEVALIQRVGAGSCPCATPEEAGGEWSNCFWLATATATPPTEQTHIPLTYAPASHPEPEFDDKQDVLTAKHPLLTATLYGFESSGTVEGEIAGNWLRLDPVTFAYFGCARVGDTTTCGHPIVRPRAVVQPTDSAGAAKTPPLTNKCALKPLPDAKSIADVCKALRDTENDNFECGQLPWTSNVMNESKEEAQPIHLGDAVVYYVKTRLYEQHQTFIVVERRSEWFFSPLGRTWTGTESESAEVVKGTQTLDLIKGGAPELILTLDSEYSEFTSYYDEDNPGERTTLLDRHMKVAAVLSVDGPAPHWVWEAITHLKENSDPEQGVELVWGDGRVTVKALPGKDMSTKAGDFAFSELDCRLPK